RRAPLIPGTVGRGLDRLHHAVVADQVRERGGLVADEGVIELVDDLGRRAVRHGDPPLDRTIGLQCIDWLIYLSTSGRLAAMTTRMPGPRERLLGAAQRLPAAQGVKVGVDAILTAASVARRSLYEHFGGKDGLVAEVLRRSAAEDEDRYRQVMQAAGDDPR